MAPIPKPAPSPQSAHANASAPPSVPRSQFPAGALGPHIGGAASAVAACTQAPLELVAHHLLTLAAMPVQRLVSVRLPTGGVQPVSCYFLTIAGAGEGRSAAERMCVAPVRFWEQRFAPPAASLIGMKAIDINKDAVWPGHPDWNPDKPFLRIRHLGPPPQLAAAKPSKAFEFDQIFLCPVRSGINDRYDRYARFGRRSGLFAGVAADLLTPSCARRNEAVSLSALWDGRAGLDNFSLEPRLSLHLVATPGEGIALLRAPEVAESGLLGRLLTVYPASRIGARSFHLGDGAPPPELEALHALLTDLYARQAAMETRVLPLAAPAQETWFAFARECEAAMAEGGAFAAIRGLAGHLAEHAVRLAAITALLEDPSREEIDAPALDRGIALARFYAMEALRLADVPVPLPAGDAIIGALQVWLERKYAGREITLREVYSSGPASLRRSASAERAMRQMELLGLAERLKPAPETHGNAGLRWRIFAGGKNLQQSAA
ncbi:MAG: DUF3987 domain-containing protein [Rhodospirillaceae bacterium]